mmetsp:Transcript_43910/g.70249  ORF Transcript_43910/g.70249 Transcript_43910/m.70249 type:complete len:1012 (+) Transcript_43910:449-3484(+)
MANNGPASWALHPDRERIRMSTKEQEEALSRFGVALGQKNPKFSLKPQILNPSIHQKSGKRSFGCLRDECRGLAMEDLTNRKWKLMYKNAKVASAEGGQGGSHFKDNLNVRLTYLECDTTELAKLKKEKKEVYDIVYSSQAGKTFLSVLEGADAIGGNKGQQLRAKAKFVRHSAPKKQQDEDNRSLRKIKRECSYNSLGIQPAQYRLYMKEECEDFLSNSGNDKTYLLKPETGSQGNGITFHKNVDAVKKKAKEFFPCKQNASMSALERKLVMEYIERPLLLERSKFDVRVYMLIASSEPWIVFYHQGYLRRSLFEYSSTSTNRAVYLTNTHYQAKRENFKLSDHIWTFDTLQAYLTRNGRAGAHYVDSVLEPYIKRVANFVFQTARPKLERRKGSFHLFGLDFMIDENFQVHFIEANGYPGYTWSINFDTRGFVAEQFNLVQELHEHPTVFERMRAGDRYAGFHLIFSELEEAKNGFKYDPCYEFYDNRRGFKVLKHAMKSFSRYTGFAAEKAFLGEDNDACTSKSCKSRRKKAKQQATRARNDAERLFQGFTDDIVGGEFIGGLKTDQFTLLANFAKQKRCSLNQLAILPATYRMYLNNECENAVKYRTQSAWIAKPVDGNRAVGFEFFASQGDLGPRFNSCQDGVKAGVLNASMPLLDFQKAAYKSSSAIQYIVQKHIQNKLVVRGRQWDIRAYMLVASTNPYFVFYRDGYVRSSLFGTPKRHGEDEDEEDDGIQRANQFTLGRLELTFEEFQILLSQEGKAGDHFMSSAFETYAKSVMRFIFQAAIPQLQKKRKSYQLFELNFMLDSSYGFWYIGANGSPQLSRTPRVVEKVIRPMQDELKSVVLETSDVPEALAGMRYGDQYGGFRLVYSDYENDIANNTYNPCKEFKHKFSLAKSAVLSTAKIHDFKTRVESANLRELKKYTRMAWDKCRVKGKTETCYESEMVRRVCKQRYEDYLDKTSVGMAEEEGLKKQQEDRDQAVQQYVESRMKEMAGKHEEQETEQQQG